MEFRTTQRGTRTRPGLATRKTKTATSKTRCL